MKQLRRAVLLSILGLGAGLALAQPGGGKGPGPGTGPGASAPGMGPGASAPGMGMGPGGGRGAARWGHEHTPGWSMMSPQERTEHQERMRSMKTYEECKTYQSQHHEQMAARAKERGGKAMGQPRRDACVGLKP